MTRTDTTVTGVFTITFNGIFTGSITGTVSYPGNVAETRLDGTYLVHTNGSTGTFQYFLLGFNALQFQGNTSGSGWCGARPGQGLPGTCLRTGPEGPRDLPTAPGPFGLPPPPP
jgi:hypothetical protein